MKRRDFLKAFLAAGATVVAAKYINLPDHILENDDLLEGEIGKFRGFNYVADDSFDPKNEYGNAVMLSEFDETQGLFVRNLLLEDARLVVKKGSYVEILRVVPSGFDRGHGVAWRYSPRIDKEVLSLDWSRAHKNKGSFLAERTIL